MPLVPRDLRAPVPGRQFLPGVTHTRLGRILLIIAGLTVAGASSAQTYVGTLDGTSPDSTFDPNSATLSWNPALNYGWRVTIGGGYPQVLEYVNTVMSGGNGYNGTNYTVLYGVPSTPLLANSTYTLSFDIG